MMKWTKQPSLLNKHARQRVAGCNLRRCLSSRQPSGEAIVTDSVWRGKFKKASARVMNPHTIFPWRHKEEPLPRLDPESEEFFTEGNIHGPGLSGESPYFNTAVLDAAAGILLQVPWYEVMLSNRWKQDLADSSAWAFSQAVAGVLTNTYDVSFDEIRKAHGELDVDFNHKTSQGLGDAEENEGFSALDCMLEENLRTLYQSAHTHGRNQLQIALQMKPVSSRYLSSIVIPGLTRDLVKKSTTALDNTFGHVWKKLAERESELGRQLSMIETCQLSFREFNLYAEQEADYIVTRHTIIIQVVVLCDEVFCVTDLSTGQVLQGFEDLKSRQVPHVVRLETEVERKLYYRESGRPRTELEVGKWRISDWDDLLEGNIWYL